MPLARHTRLMAGSAFKPKVPLFLFGGIAHIAGRGCVSTASPCSAEKKKLACPASANITAALGRGAETKI